MRGLTSFPRGILLITATMAFAMSTLLVATPPASGEVFVAQAPVRAWGVDGRVHATAIAGDILIVGGTFGNAVSPTGQQVARRNLAAFDRTTGALLAGWRADASDTVRALEVDGDEVYVGGAFAQLDGQTRRRLGRVDVASGEIDLGFDVRPNATVRALAVDATGVYAGGHFTSVDGLARHRLVRLHKADGRVDTGFVAHADHNVFGLARHPTAATLYVSGRFGTLSGANRNGVGAVDSATGTIRPISFTGSALRTLGLAINDDGSRLFGAGGGNNAAAAWSTTTGNRVWRQVAMGDIQAVMHYRGTVYFGFHEGFQGDTTVKVLAADAATGVLDPGFRPRVNVFMGVFALAASDDGIAIGGDFTQVAGVTALRVAWFPATD